MNIVRSFRKDSFKEFLSAIKNCDLEKVKNTFNQEFINKRILDEPNGLRPIHVACEYDCVDIVKYLIDRGCDFEQRTNESLLPVHFACKYGKIDVLLLLINHKCNLTCQTNMGYTPLHLACDAGMVDVVKVMLTYNCPIDILTKNGIRPVDLEKNNKDIVALLSEKNCLFDFKGNNFSSEIELDVEDLDNYGNEIFKCVRDKNIAQFINIYDPQKPIMNDRETELTLMEYAISEKAYDFVELILSDNAELEAQFKICGDIHDQSNSRWRSKMAAPIFGNSPICRWAPDRGRDQTMEQFGIRACFMPRTGNKGIYVIFCLNINKLNLLNLIRAFESVRDFWGGSIAPAGCLCLWSPIFLI